MFFSLKRKAKKHTKTLGNYLGSILGISIQRCKNKWPLNFVNEGKYVSNKLKERNLTVKSTDVQSQREERHGGRKKVFKDGMDANSPNF